MVHSLHQLAKTNGHAIDFCVCQAISNDGLPRLDLNDFTPGELQNNHPSLEVSILIFHLSLWKSDSSGYVPHKVRTCTAVEFYLLDSFFMDQLHKLNGFHSLNGFQQSRLVNYSGNYETNDEIVKVKIKDEEDTKKLPIIIPIGTPPQTITSCYCNGCPCYC
ncbi:hypothetical protein BC941DRAFT_475919 [Chlamydoabsidia padenii]|nr:hypothetical protein BC941DRAFT_475919 [Chlamydoabsidia padenii]